VIRIVSGVVVLAAIAAAVIVYRGESARPPVSVPNGDSIAERELAAVPHWFVVRIDGFAFGEFISISAAGFEVA
jgi:hypothetical protein